MKWKLTWQQRIELSNLITANTANFRIMSQELNNSLNLFYFFFFFLLKKYQEAVVSLWNQSRNQKTKKGPGNWIPFRGTQTLHTDKKLQKIDWKHNNTNKSNWKHISF